MKQEDNTCPKDADTAPTDIEEGCQSRFRTQESHRGLFYCTRKEGHAGLHHAHNQEGKYCAKTWTPEEAVIEAL